MSVVASLDALTSVIDGRAVDVDRNPHCWLVSLDVTVVAPTLMGWLSVALAAMRVVRCQTAATSKMAQHAVVSQWLGTQKRCLDISV